MNASASMFDVTAVRERRLRQFAELMARHDLAAIVISSGEFFQFYANIAISTFYWERPFALVVPRRGAAFAVVNAVAENGVRLQLDKGIPWVDDFSFYCEVPQVRSGSPLTAEFAKALTAAMIEHGLDRGRIGYDARTGAIASLAAALPGATLHDMADGLKELRWVKHESEIRVMQMAADLGGWAMQTLRGELRPGRLLQELDQTVGARLMEEAAQRVPGQNFLIVKIITLSGPASASTDGDGAPTGAVVQADVPTVSTIVTRLNGYSVEVHRTFWIGQPSPSQEAMLQAALGMNQAAIGQAFAGNRLSAIDEEAVKAARAAGVERYVVHRAGHGIGTATHEYPEDLPVNRRTLSRGEVLSLEPGLYVAGLGGFRFGDAVVAEATPRVLTRTPKSMADIVVS